MEKQKLENFLYYMLDKIDDCYKKEVEAAVKEFLKETAQEVPVQEQSEEISNSELLVLLITIESLISKAIQGLRSSEPLYKTTT